MTITLDTIRKSSVGETLTAEVDYTDRLDSDETLSGTPTIASSGAGLTVSSPAVNAAALTILGTSVAIGKAVTFTAVAVTAGLYTVTVTVGTSQSQTLVRAVKVRIE